MLRHLRQTPSYADIPIIMLTARPVFVRIARAMKMGDPMNALTDVGPLISRRQQESVLGYIAQGKRDGGVLATGGGIPN